MIFFGSRNHNEYPLLALFIPWKKARINLVATAKYLPFVSNNGGLCIFKLQVIKARLLAAVKICVY